MDLDPSNISALVLRAQDKDQRAGEELFRLFGSSAYRLALKFTKGHVGDAEDLLQDSFVTCLGHLGDLREPSRFGSWLLKTVRNLAINRYQAAKSRSRFAEQLERDVGLHGTGPLNPTEALAKKQRENLVREVFDACPDGPAKETARLYYFEGVENTELVAEQLGVPKSTVTTRLDRFRTTMRKKMLCHLARGTTPEPPSDGLPEVRA